MAHRTRQEIIDDLKYVAVRPNQRYQHYKSKGIYVVEKLVVLEASDEVAVAYYDEDYPELIWVRSYSDFTMLVDGRTPRFSLLS